ncbi:high mobility group protein B2 isoform X2 [Odocoileus virginianus]|uniref:High mobility group protein B2 isoform X2 n=1 Tax=Odocoileus virginianus TaxID=9874 RepID=A0ABM4J9N3_ODOVR
MGVRCGPSPGFVARELGPDAGAGPGRHRLPASPFTPEYDAQTKGEERGVPQGLHRRGYSLEGSGTSPPTLRRANRRGGGVACDPARQVAVARRSLQNKRRRIALARNQFTPEPEQQRRGETRPLRGTLRKISRQVDTPPPPQQQHHGEGRPQQAAGQDVFVRLLRADLPRGAQEEASRLLSQFRRVFQEMFREMEDHVGQGKVQVRRHGKK